LGTQIPLSYADAGGKKTASTAWRIIFTVLVGLLPGF
jgi:hypothetical protein